MKKYAVGVLVALAMVLFVARSAHAQNPGILPNGVIAAGDCMKWGPTRYQAQSAGAPCATPYVANALTRTNDTNVTVTLGGTPATALLQSVSMTIGWQSTLAASRGGFGADVSAQTGIALNTAGVFSWLASNGTGNVARTTNVALITPDLGTPSAVNLANATNLPFGSTTGTVPINRGGTGQITAPLAITALLPTATLNGSLAFWNGTSWATFAGNAAGTKVLTEDASGNLSWGTPGTGTVTSIGLVAGSAAVSGTCTITTTGTCPVVSQGAPTAWTPTDGSGAGLTFAGVSANYSRIGNMVFAYAQLTYPSTANGATAMLSGFPVAFPAATYSQQCSVSFSNVTGGVVRVVPTAGTSTATVYSAVGAAVTNTTMSTAQLNIMCIYPAT